MVARSRRPDVLLASYHPAATSICRQFVSPDFCSLPGRGSVSGGGCRKVAPTNSEAPADRSTTGQPGLRVAHAGFLGGLLFGPLFFLVVFLFVVVVVLVIIEFFVVVELLVV